MTQAVLDDMRAYYEELRQRCDTPEKARAQLQLEGFLDEHGKIAPDYLEPGENSPWR